jgi:hypothetical protein
LSRRRVLGGAALVVLLSLFASGCADGEEVELTIKPGEARRAASGLYIGDARLRFAEQSLIAQCMADRGLPYRVAPEGADTGLPTMSVSDVEKAKEEGYGLATERAQADAVTSLEDERIGLPPRQQREYDRALFGPARAPEASARSLAGDVITASTQGCIAEARTRLFGSVENFLVLSEFLGNSVRFVMYQSREESPEVQEAFEEWQACMASAGYPDLEERNGGEALARVAYEEESLARASELETRIAVTDAECDQQAEYSQAATVAENRALAEYFSKYEGQIAGIQEIREKAIVNAREILIG